MILLRLACILCPSTHRVAPYNPTQPMTRAAAKSMSPGVRDGQPWVSVREKHIIRYQWMLDAINNHNQDGS